MHTSPPSNSKDRLLLQLRHPLLDLIGSSRSDMSWPLATLRRRRRFYRTGPSSRFVLFSDVVDEGVDVTADTFSGTYEPRDQVSSIFQGWSVTQVRGICLG